MNGKRLRGVVPVLLPCLLAGGCMVTSSKYEMKTKEADTLRDAVASVSKEKTVLEARTEALRKQLDDEKTAAAALESRVQALEADNRRMGEDLAAAKKSYEGTRITREELINELLEKEKTTGKRIQGLTDRAQACETTLELLRKDSAVRDSQLSQLKDVAERSVDNEALRRERDILLGRVERLTDERRQEERRRDNRFTALTEEIAKVSKEVSVTPLGPALRVALPESVLHAKGKTGLSEGGKKTIALAGRAAAEFPTSSILVSAGGKKVAGEIRTALAGAGKIPEDRILVKIYEKEKGAELLLLVP